MRYYVCRWANPVPDRFAWVDRVVPYLIFALGGVIILVAAVT